MPTHVPDAALKHWVASIPSVRCTPAVLAPWLGRPPSAGGPETPAPHFERGSFTTVSNGVVSVVTVPSAGAAELHYGSEAQEESYSAVLGEAGTPPRAVETKARTARIGAVGLGSTRADVERLLGPGRTLHTACGTDVVTYVQSPQEISFAYAWFIYRAGRVVAFARYEAV